MLISIVVPFYRIEKSVIKACVDSIAQQTYMNIETFLIDDGNTDGTNEYLDHLADKIPFIKVIHQKNSGVSVARNAGIAQAKGDYIVFLDGDDCLEPHCAEEYVKIAKDTKADIIYSEHTVFKNVCTFQWNQNETWKDLKDNDKVIRSVISSGTAPEKGLHGAPWGKAFSREFLIKNNLLFNVKLPRSQDNEFNFRAAQCATKMVYYSQVTYGYRESNQSAMTRFRKDSKSIQEEYLDTIISDAHNASIYDLVEHDIQVVTIIKFFDICNTQILHRENDISFLNKRKTVSRILKESRYNAALKEVSLSDFEGAPKVFVFLLKNKLYGLYCIAHALRIKLKLIIRKD